MRILYLWDADYPWDVRTEKVCASLTAAGHEVTIVARNRAWRPEVERLREGTVRRMRPWRFLGRALDGLLSFPAFFSPRWRRHLTRAVRETRPSVIVVRDLPLCPLAIRVARRTGTRVVFDMAEHYPALLRQTRAAGRQRPLDLLVRNPRLADAVERWCLPRVDRVVTVIPESAQRVIESGVPAARVSVVCNTPPAERVHESRRRPRGAGEPLHLVYMGLMEVPRGIEDLLRAVALLRSWEVRVRLVLIGGGRDLPLLRERAAALGLTEPWVEFTGWIASHQAALAQVAAADVGVLPHRRDASWDSTIPNKLFDFMAAGLAVASSDPIPTARVVRETACGVVFPSRAPEAMAHALLRLRDPQVREALGAAGRRAILSRYNWETDAAAMVATVESAGAEGARVHAARPHPGRRPVLRIARDRAPLA